jgi:hypothetical protein
MMTDDDDDDDDDFYLNLSFGYEISLTSDS